MSARRGFTLIEVLVAVGILALLAGLTLAAVQRARESARRAECQNKLRQQGLAVLNYEAATGRLPPGAVTGPFEPLNVPGGVSHGMWPLLLGYLDQVPLAERYRLDRPFDAPENQPVTAARLAVLECRNAPGDRGPPGVTDFGPIEVNPFLADIGLIDPVAKFESALPANGMVRLTDITDGTSSTLLLAEAGGRPGAAWAAPEALLDLRSFFGGANGLHRGGTNACFADGSVRFLRDSLDLKLVARLATRSGGEVVGDW